jgi:GTP-binding protein YchF
MKRIGLLGLPQSGKSTVFEVILQGAGVEAKTASGRETIGVVKVPDERVDRLSALYSPKSTVHSQVQFVDTVAAASQGKPSKGPDLFASVRNCDALVAVVREFDSDADAARRDVRTLEAELILNDLALVETRRERIDKELRIGKKQNEREHSLLVRFQQALEAEQALRGMTLDAEEEKLVRGFQLLTMKPLLVVYNQGEAGQAPPSADGPHTGAVGLKALLEREVLGLPESERPGFRTELGLEEDGLTTVIRACFELLGLISFFTVGEDEVRAWTLSRGSTAVDAAGEIHSDLAKGFIRAEVIPWDKLLEVGGEKGARERGWLRLEGREYVVQDGDCLNIRFNR